MITPSYSIWNQWVHWTSIASQRHKKGITESNKLDKIKKGWKTKRKYVLRWWAKKVIYAQVGCIIFNHIFGSSIHQSHSWRTHRDRRVHFLCTCIIPQWWYSRRKFIILKLKVSLWKSYVGWIQNIGVMCVWKWSKGDIFITIESFIWLRGVCTIILWYIHKDYKITWVCGQYIL